MTFGYITRDLTLNIRHQLNKISVALQEIRGRGSAHAGAGVAAAGGARLRGVEAPPPSRRARASRPRRAPRRDIRGDRDGSYTYG